MDETFEYEKKEQPEAPQMPVETDGTWRNPGGTIDEFLESKYSGEVADDIAKSEALDAQEEKFAALQEQQAKDQGFLPDNPIELVKETTKAAYGGATDAIESVGSTLDLAGDTVKTMLHNARGIPLSAEEGNVGLEGYKPEPVRYLDVPRRYEVENESGLGNLARGMVEFGLLIKATAMTGGTLAPGLLGSGTRAMALNRAVGSKLLKGATASKFAPLRGFARSGPGTKFIKFIPTGARIGAEGSIADAISSSSDYANLANLVEEYAPWFPFAEWLSIDPDKDNPYTARLKTVLAGGGANLVFAGLLGFARGRFAALKARKDGATLEESNRIGNIAKDETIKQEIRQELETRNTLKDQDIEDGKGISSDARKDWTLKHLPEEDRTLYQWLTEGNLPDTRGNSIYFHGSAKGLKGDFPYIPTGEYRWTDENLFGDGFYTTDDFTVALKDRVPTKGLVHQLDNSGKTRVVYKTTELQPVKFFDADQKFSADDLDSPEVKIFKKISVYDYNLDDMVPLWPESGSITYTELVDRIKDSTLYPREEVTPLLNNIDISLQELGYGGLTYKGSIIAPEGMKLSREHQVKVYWEPETQIELSRIDPDGGFELGGGGPDAPPDAGRTAKIQELEELADANANAAGDPWIDDLGNSAETAGKEASPTPDRNPNKFTDSEKTVLPDDSRTLKAKVTNIIGENLERRKRTGKIGSDSMLLNERQIRRLSQGNPEMREHIIKISEAVADQVFESTQNSYNYKDVQNLFIEQAAEMHSRLEVDGAKGLRDYFLKNEKDKFTFMYEGTEVVTGTASQKVALEILINTLSKKAALTAEGSLDLPNGVSKQRALTKTNEALQVAMLEYKKISYMMGSEFAKLGAGTELLPADAKRKITKDLKEIELEQKQYNDEITRLIEANEPQMLKDLAELHAYTNGDVRTMHDLTEYIRAAVTGGRFRGKNIRARWRTEAATAMYNSILSGPATPARAIVGTNFIGILRPFQEYLGGMVTGSKQDMVVATAQINALGEAWAEGIRLFKHNWDQGLAKKPQSYQGKFDLEKDATEWKRLYEFNQRYGTDNEKTAYGITNWFVDFNQSPWLKYPQILMGSGDAMARTIIGRYQMRLQAATDAIASGVDLDDVAGIAAKQDDIFRKKIFRKNKMDMWVVRDKAAKMAGDETALTTPLRGSLEGLEKLRNITGMRHFFPFVRTGANALDLTWQHTPILAQFHGKWRDIMNGDPQLLFKKYGIREQDITQAQALMRGRVASGTAIMGLTAIMAMSGKITGTLPQDKETRDLWRITGTKPMSIKIGNTYVSYQNFEPYNTLMAATANVLNYQHVLGEDLRDDMLEKIRFMFAAVLVDKSMLAGVSDLAEVFSGNTSQEQLLRITAKMARSQFAPYAGLSRQLGDIMDANQREARGFLETMFKQDLIFKNALPKKYDILNKDRSGKEFRADQTNPLMKTFNMLSTVPITWTDGDKVKENLRIMQYNLPEVMRQWKGIDLTSKEISQLQLIMSQGDLRKRLERLMRKGGRWEKGLKEYRRLGLTSRSGFRLQEQEFYLDVHKIFMSEKKKALLILRSQNPALYDKVKDRQYRKGHSKYGNYDTIEKILAIPK